MKNKKTLALYCGLGIALIGAILSNTYRPFIYMNDYYDYHFADVIGSLICVPSSTLFFYGISSKYQFTQLIYATTIAFVLYELLSFIPIHGTFDFYDLLAICIGTIITSAIHLTLKFK